MSNALTDGVTNLFSGEQNLSMTERTLSVIGGLALAAVGAQPRPNKWLSLAAVLAGSALAMRGATGHCGVKALMQENDPVDALENRYRSVA